MTINSISCPTSDLLLIACGRASTSKEGTKFVALAKQELHSLGVKADDIDIQMIQEFILGKHPEIYAAVKNTDDNVGHFYDMLGDRYSDILVSLKSKKENLLISEDEYLKGRDETLDNLESGRDEPFVNKSVSKILSDTVAKYKLPKTLRFRTRYASDTAEPNMATMTVNQYEY